MASHPDPTDNGEASPDEPKSGVIPSAPDWAPDSSVPSSVPVARVALARHAGGNEEASVTRLVRLSLLVRSDNEPTAAAYVTLSLPGGRVAFEGSTNASGAIEVALVVPIEAKELLLLVEHGTKYRHTNIPLQDGREHVSYELG